MLVATDDACVAIMQAVEGDFADVETRYLNQLVRIMELWCEQRALTPQHFNPNEGRVRRGDVNVLVKAFKSGDVRLYGGVFHVRGKRTFIVVDADTAKKQKKADPTRLNRAKGRALDLADQLRAQG